MRLLLDTQVGLWWLTASPRLSKSSRELMVSSPCAVSVASVWEIDLKHRLGKLPIAPAPFRDEMRSAGAIVLSVTDVAVAIIVHECKAVLAADPRSAPAHMLLGLACLAQGSIAMVAEAKAELQQALDIDPELLWARFYLARLYLDQGLSEKAQEQLERSLQQSPGLPHFLSLLGEVRRKLGDPGASLELNRKALEANATMTPAHYFLALAYLDLQQEQAAIA